METATQENIQIYLNEKFLSKSYMYIKTLYLLIIVHTKKSRHVIWQANQQYIDTHNRYNASFGYTLAMNRLGDQSYNRYDLPNTHTHIIQV